MTRTAKHTHNLGACGIKQDLATADLIRHAARAKAKVKASARGWSMLSQTEIVALAWFADFFLRDADLPKPAPATPEPKVVSHV